ncbi:MAG TPA: pilus assembly protein PilM [Chromatiaceae bacterium]|jgi:type IV pilus assembly protein PilM|nr:MAG: hypothetical protein N838_02975 [Thiohalocapsa sp. PB-PSB1]QQO56912.1 MAG: pilus assembly protein PilM [Thiohalocapsa sp. PB-PSB1]HBG94917.1 pilus assembly protein PilM [Chromatiaceae bacterium]HCS91849.1 pilus assembly protein PilM [Chromatiaceae bacterium]
MFGFGRKSSNLFGLDIGSTSVKLIELSRASGTGAELYRVDAFAVEPLPTGAVVERKIADIDAVGQCIQNALRRSGSKTKRAAVALSGSSVITKVIPMTASLSDAEMETQIQVEADQYIPYPLEEVNIDFDIVGPTAGNTEMVDVLIAASRRENVDDRVATLEIAGLTAAIVDVEAFAMENACALLLGHSDEAHASETVALADVGASTTTLHVFHGERTIYTREQNFGGDQLLDEIQHRYGMSKTDALENLAAETLPEDFETDVLIPFKDAMSQQIARALQFFYSATTFNRTDQVILAGGVAVLPNLAPFVGKRLGFPVSIANPFSIMGFAPEIDRHAIDHAAPSMMTATGLALRSFD